MNKSRMVLIVTTLAAIPVSFAAENADRFSRANCFNNESITYNYFNPPKYRLVFSRHFKNGDLKHYVTEGEPDWTTCLPGFHGNHQVNGLYCYHFLYSATRQAGVHGAFLSSEPNPDGNLFPGITSDWRVEGVHYAKRRFGQIVSVDTEATDCNLHLDQFY